MNHQTKKNDEHRFHMHSILLVWKNSLSCYEWLWCRMNKNGWIVKKINEVKINAMNKWRQVRNTITLESYLQLWCIVLAVRYTVRKSIPSYPICGMNTFHLAPDDGATTYIVAGNKSRGAVTFVYHHHLHWKRKLHDKLHMVPMPEVLFGCKQKIHPMCEPPPNVYYHLEYFTLVGNTANKQQELSFFPNIQWRDWQRQKRSKFVYCICAWFYCARTPFLWLHSQHIYISYVYGTCRLSHQRRHFKSYYSVSISVVSFSTTSCVYFIVLFSISIMWLKRGIRGKFCSLSIHIPIQNVKRIRLTENHNAKGKIR